MKKLKLFNLFLFLACFCNPFSTQIVGQWGDYCFNFRWVTNNGEFHTQGFQIPYWVHSNLSTYYLNPEPECPNPSIGSGCEINSNLFPISVAAAAMNWNNVGAYPWLQVQGITSATPIADQDDDTNIIGFDYTQFVDNFEILAKCIIYQSEDAYLCSTNAPYHPTILFKGFDIAINNNVKWDVLEGSNETDIDYACYDFESVMLHEFGHALGLCHPAGANINNDVMHGNIMNAQIRRTLSNLDAEALKALYPATPPYPPCEIFRPDNGFDKGTKQSGNNGGGGSICHYIPPGSFSTEATREMAFFWEQNLGNNFNLLMRRFVQNTDALNDIFTSTDSRYDGVQNALDDLLIILTPLLEDSFAENDSVKITTAHINAVCCWIEEMLPMFDILDFHRESAFLLELKNLQKGLSALLDKDVRTALFDYDSISSFSGMGECVCSSSKRGFEENSLSVMMYEGRPWLRIYLEKEAKLQYHLFDLTGAPVLVLHEGHLPTGVHLTEISSGTLKPGLYLAVPFLNNVFQPAMTVKFTVLQ
ncbi:MAG: matrixin family metalloprotease [Sphingobacteriales bacterium]|nr:MAG: matrixin family metalloprotease [Sphingobacteriales bacterium]